MLAYGTSAYQLGEVLKIAVGTCLDILGKFAEGAIEVFGDEYLWPPRSDELEQILKENEDRGFPGCTGSIDCYHWPWKNCPKGWAGQFTSGKQGVPTIIFEVVASKNLRTWHAFFGSVGSQNDINVLNKSPLFIEAIRGKYPSVRYTVNENQYDMGYYLAHKYPEWAAFVKTIDAPQSAEDKLFSQRRESVRKDVEKAFGVLQACFNIVRRPARLWKQADVINIMQACVVLHNIIVEDEKEAVTDVLDLKDNPSAAIVIPPEVRTNDNPDPSYAEALRRNLAIKARPTHRQLKKDLIEHICQRYGNKER
jgi:hypothetical protein